MITLVEGVMMAMILFLAWKLSNLSWKFNNVLGTQNEILQGLHSDSILGRN